MASIRDIAAACGCSVATVSKAVNGHKDISEETRLRVMKAAQELGYQPSLAARALKTNRTYDIGVLFQDQVSSGLTHHFFAIVLEGFKKEAEHRGYDITFINNRINGRKASYLEHCRYRGVDGAVIACTDFSDPQVMELVRSGLPTATVDYMFDSEPSVVSNNVEGAGELVRYLVSMGHRRIGFIHGDGESPVTPKRLLGFRTACAESGLRVPDEYVRAARYHDPDTCARQALAMMKQRVPPTALLFPDDYSALGGVEALRSLGLRIPEDVSVVGYDGLPLCRAFYPRLTTYWQDGAGLGATAATLLIEHIETTDQGAPVSRSVMISGHLQRGGSVMPPKR